MEGKHSVVRKHSGIWKSLRDGDFEEEEIWDVLKHTPDSNSGIHRHKEKELSPLHPPRPLPTASRMIPSKVSNCGPQPQLQPSSSNNSSASSSHEVKFLQQSSAPVNIPDWTKVNQQKKACRSVSRLDCNDDAYHSVFYDEDGGGGANDGGDSDECGKSKLPPHEFIAKRLARTQISSFSVLEGVGRTLKGRDLSKVRDAVLSKTGFFEGL